MINLQIGEILQKIHSAPTRHEKISVMRHYNEGYFIGFCATIFDPRFVPAYGSLVDVPEYKKDHPPYGYAESTLISETKRIRIWHRGYVQDRVKLDRITQTTLSAMNDYEATVMASIISGSSIPCDGFDEDLVRDAFPGLLTHEPKPKPIVATPSKEEVSQDIQFQSPMFRGVLVSDSDVDTSSVEGGTEQEAVQACFGAGFGEFNIYSPTGELLGTRERYTPTGRVKKQYKTSPSPKP